MQNKTQLEHINIDTLTPYARNSRTHSDDQVSQIVESIRRFGFTNPVLIDETGGIIAGHGRVMAAQQLGMETVPAIRIDYMSDEEKRAYIIADNKLALNAGWDDELLKLELGELNDLGFDLSLTGFSDDELSKLLLDEDDIPGEGDNDQIPEPAPKAVSFTGDVWLLGDHRVMCGDSTMIDHIEKLMAGRFAELLHADPPYGMGKESDGVANDNLYGENLDRFQMDWWSAFRTVITDNASAYIWGNASDLWRLWYVGGLSGSEKLELRNHIVWDKESIPGKTSEGLTKYPIATEHCLFFQIGDQLVGNVNSDLFPESWEPIRGYLDEQAKAAGLVSADVKRICGCGMYSHWFTRSQFTLIPKQHYEKLAASLPGYFLKPWRELKSAWDKVKLGPNSKHQGIRSYFDNTHEIMHDVWRFPRVTGEERHGHATPKPVAMMERIMKSSLPKGGLCAEPFGGSGSTLIGAEKTGRICYTMEMKPQYVDVIIKRWQKLTGEDAILEATGKTFNEIADSMED